MQREQCTEITKGAIEQLNLDIYRGASRGRILWQPRIGCWLRDREFRGDKLPKPYEGMTKPEIYKALHCSARPYEAYARCFKRIEDSRVHKYTAKLNEFETEYITETPVGKISAIGRRTPSSPREIKKKWLITSEEDIKVACWIEERCQWVFDEEAYLEEYAIWGELGASTMYLPRVNIQHLYINVMGVQETVFALSDYPGTVEKYFKALDESHERLIEVVNRCPIQIVNFGDNLHCSTLSPALFEKYVLPAYQKRNELLHKAGKYTNSHWDGNTKALLPYAKECGLDGIEAITPEPMGDVTLEEMKEALGDQLILIDGIAAILFDDIFPEEDLISQTHRIIELFAPKLILGISDEISSTGNIERIRIVGRIVDNYNAAKISSKTKGGGN